MRVRRARCLKKRELRGAPRPRLEAMLKTAEERLVAIDEVIDGGADMPHIVTERCVWEHNKRLLVEHLAKLPA